MLMGEPDYAQGDPFLGADRLQLPCYLYRDSINVCCL